MLPVARFCETSRRFPLGRRIPFYSQLDVVVSTPLDEFSLIDWIRARAADHERLALGIGDDAALLKLAGSGETLLAVDLLMEGVHFTIPPATAEEVGRKALAVNLSDMAAMAGRPVATVVSAALPRQRGAEFSRQTHEGLLQLANEYDVALAGGDTNIWDGPLVMSVTVVGEPTGRGVVRRSGASVGDWILATGSFGRSLCGKHLTFTPRIREAIRLNEHAALHAMIDVSDGLAADLHHILDESSAGARLYAERIPISDDAERANDGKSPLEHALTDGEDFELLFTVSAEDGRRLLENPPIETAISHIGEIVDGRDCLLVDALGGTTPLPAAGWEHRF